MTFVQLSFYQEPKCIGLNQALEYSPLSPPTILFRHSQITTMSSYVRRLILANIDLHVSHSKTNWCGGFHLIKTIKSVTLWCYYRSQVWEGAHKSKQCWHPSRASWNNGTIVWQKTFCPWFPYCDYLSHLFISSSISHYNIVRYSLYAIGQCAHGVSNICHLLIFFIVISYYMYESWMCK